VTGTGLTNLKNTSVQGLTAENTWLGKTTITGQTDINTTGSAITTIGNSAATTNVFGAFNVSALTNINTTGSNDTNIGNTGTITLNGVVNATGLTGYATTTALALKANTLSPTFTGTVTIPTGASIAGYAPLAGPNFTGTPQISGVNIATITNVNLKANIESPTFTGTVGLPTTNITGGVTVTGVTTLGVTNTNTLSVKGSRSCITIKKSTDNATGDVSVLGFNNGGGHEGPFETDNFPDSNSQYGTMFGARIKSVAVSPYGVQSDLYFQSKSTGGYGFLTDGNYTNMMIMRAGSLLVEIPKELKVGTGGFANAENLGMVNIKSDTRGTAIVFQPNANNNWIMEFKNTSGGTRGVIGGVNADSIQYATTSDRRLKTSIEPMDSVLDKFMSLKPSKYNWKSDNLGGIGFIAQEVFEIFPEMRNVTSDFSSDLDEPVHVRTGEPIYHSIDYSKFTPYITKAVQEMKIGYDAKIALLETRLNACEQSQAGMSQPDVPSN